MAANAKEYNDLTQTTEISNDALVAVATPGASQLQTSTVTTLAAKVGELNTAGALSELELATSIGKQQLAEALTEKGAASTPSDTLVQMADKLKNLHTDEATSTLTCTLLNDTDITSTANGIPYPFAYVRLANDDLVVLGGSTLAYVDHTLEYTNVSGMLESATSSVECNITLSTKSNSWLNISANTEYLAVPLSYTEVAFYHINLIEKTIELVKTVTLPTEIFHYSTGNNSCAHSIGITNDGKYYFYVSYSDKKITAYSVTEETVKATTSTLGSYYLDLASVPSSVLIETDNGGTVCHSASGNGHHAQFNVDYTVDETGITFNAVDRLPLFSLWYCPPQFKGYGMTYEYSNWYPSGTNLNYAKKYTLKVYDVKTQTLMGSIDIPYVLREREAYLTVQPNLHHSTI